MRLLIDTDAFCKLALTELLSDTFGLFGAEIGECGRLAALPYMLRRGTLPRSYGAEACGRLVRVAESMPAVVRASPEWLERLAHVPAVDPGEAILLSAAADAEIPVISNDLRALRAVKEIEEFGEALAGRVVILEAVLLSLCHGIGAEALRARLEPIRQKDMIVRVCFSPDNQEPEEGLRSYFEERRREVAPLVLWTPRTGEDA